MTRDPAKKPTADDYLELPSGELVRKHKAEELEKHLAAQKKADSPSW